PHMLCVTNLILHGVGIPDQVIRTNALARPLRDYTAEDRVDVIVTNPPFRGMEPDGIEQNFPAVVRTRETADLFLALVIHLLNAEGRGGVVLPDSSLWDDGVKEVLRERLLTECRVDAVIRLPR